MGKPFFENFVAVFDYDDNKISFGLNKNALPGAGITEANWDEKLTGLHIFGIFLAAFVVLMIVCLCATRCIKATLRRREQKRADLLAYD